MRTIKNIIKIWERDGLFIIPLRLIAALMVYGLSLYLIMRSLPDDIEPAIRFSCFMLAIFGSGAVTYGAAGAHIVLCLALNEVVEQVQRYFERTLREAYTLDMQDALLYTLKYENQGALTVHDPHAETFDATNQNGDNEKEQ